MNRPEQIREFLSRSGYGDAALSPLAGDASFRRYIRIRDGNHSLMLMDAPPEKEDVRPYLAIAGHLSARGFSAPAVVAQDIAAGLLLLEDLGDASFTSVLNNDAALEPSLYEAAVEVLAHWHDAAQGFADKSALPLPAYDEALLLQEAGLFSQWFLPQVIGREAAAELGEEYRALWREILKAAPLSTHIWVHRDYHADNLMWLPKREQVKRVGLLDFQDGVYGDAAYDLVSLLEDARRDVPPALAGKMLSHYIALSGADRQRLETAYALLGAQRNSKIIGIFSRLAIRDRKPGYLRHLPRVWKHLEHDLAHPALARLRQWLDRHVLPQYRAVIEVAA